MNRRLQLAALFSGSRFKRRFYVSVAFLGTGGMATAAFAAQDRLPEFPLLTVLAAVFGSGGVAAWVTHALTVRSISRKHNADADLAEADAMSTSAKTIGELISQVRALHDEVTKARDQARSAESWAHSLTNEIEKLREQFNRVVGTAALALAANRVKDLNSFSDLFDLVPFGVVFTSAIEGGRFEWVNLAMASQLGYTRDEVIAKGWRALVNPADLEVTSKAEASAATGPVWGLRNRYVAADGSLVSLVWYAVAYHDATSVAFAFRADQITSDQPMTIPPAVHAPRIPVRRAEKRGNR